MLTAGVIGRSQRLQTRKVASSVAPRLLKRLEAFLPSKAMTLFVNDMSEGKREMAMI